MHVILVDCIDGNILYHHMFYEEKVKNADN